MKKLTSEMLEKLVEQVLNEKKNEKAKKPISVKAKEVDADELADTLEKKVNHMKDLRVKEAKIIEALQKIREAKKAAVKAVNDLLLHFVVYLFVSR